MLPDSGSSVIPLVKLSSTHAPSSSEVGVRSGHRSANAANEERKATLSCLAGVALRPHMDKRGAPVNGSEESEALASEVTTGLYGAVKAGRASTGLPRLVVAAVADLSSSPAYSWRPVMAATHRLAPHCPSHIHPINLRATNRDDSAANLIRPGQKGRVVSRTHQTRTGSLS